jgi:hypothetical protein
MINNEKLALAEAFIERGELKNAKKTLIEILENSEEEDDIDVIIKNANTIIALEIIDQVIKQDPNTIEELQKELSAQTKSCETSSRIDDMIAKGLL